MKKIKQIHTKDFGMEKGRNARLVDMPGLL
jgi:hypothetical protein